MILEVGKEYEAIIYEEIKMNSVKVKDIMEIENVFTFIKEVFISDKNIGKELKENIVVERG